MQEVKSYSLSSEEISYNVPMKQSDPVRELIATEAERQKVPLSHLSLGVGKNHAYLQQFIERGVPRKLPEEVRSTLARLLKVNEDLLRHERQQLDETFRKTAKLIRSGGNEPSEVVKEGEGWPDLGGEWMDVRGVTVGGDDSFFYFGDVIDQVRRPPGIRNAKNVAALNVAGDSMIPRFKAGELIYVQDRVPAPGDDVVVEMFAENEGDQPKSFLKELTKKTGRRLYCKQHNPASDIEFDMGEVKTVWRVLTLRDLLG